MVGQNGDNIYVSALKRKDELIVELEALTSFIESYERLLALRASMDRHALDQPNLFGQTSRRVARAEKIAEMIDAARRIVISEKRPMQRGELRQRLEKLGFEIVGADKNKVFGTNLWRSGRFRMIEGQGYWPIDVELPSEFLR
ncbi:MAG: hypothetical protein K2Y20_03165 [Sphingomonas sp.]|nr:hypothetical protein [Sphingomonas sp.]